MNMIQNQTPYTYQYGFSGTTNPGSSQNSSGRIIPPPGNFQLGAAALGQRVRELEAANTWGRVGWFAGGALATAIATFTIGSFTIGSLAPVLIAGGIGSALGDWAGRWIGGTNELSNAIIDDIGANGILDGQEEMARLAQRYRANA